MRRAGHMYKIQKGVWIGNYAIAYIDEQEHKINMAGKKVCWLFEDELCTKPVLKFGEPRKVLIQNKFLHLYGFTD